MNNQNDISLPLIDALLSFGAYKAALIDASAVETDVSFRTMCESNACGLYGKCWTCPPDVGNIDALMDELRGYSHALVYQTVSELEDSFDVEGMFEARKVFNGITMRVRKLFAEQNIKDALHLGAGGCGVCESCAKRTNEPCRSPELATASLEAYGVNVSKLASSAQMKYINGADTVTYFGAVFFNI